jgi:hypothetical protein
MWRLVTGPIIACTWLTSAAAQAPSGRLLVRVVDETGAIIQGASVTVSAGGERVPAETRPVVHTADSGLAVVEALPPGRYSIQVEARGFERAIVPGIAIARGDVRQAVTLRVQKLQETVTVKQDAPISGQRRAAFDTTLTADELDALPDDVNDLARRLQELGGPDAIIRVDSFEGAPLPPKAQIKAIHVIRDQFAAESEIAGSTFVDVVTQPGIGPVRGGVSLLGRADAISGRSPFVEKRGVDQSWVYVGNIAGSLRREQSGFSLNVNVQRQYAAPNLNAVLPTGPVAQALNLRQTNNQVTVYGLIDTTITTNQVLRIGISQNSYTADNLGIGAYDLPERSYSNEATSYGVRVQHAGPIGRRAFVNSRVAVSRGSLDITSATDAPTIIVQEAFTRGGAQRTGTIDTTSFSFASDVDYIHGIHSWRAGFMSYGGWFSSTANTNYLGTYVFSSLDALNSGRPVLYTRQVGDPSVAYVNAQNAVYVQDDVRIRRGLTITPGVRYSFQTHTRQTASLAPRFGITWTPPASPGTTVRASAGIFHGWLTSTNYEQTLRIDGIRQRELVILDPAFPNAEQPNDGTLRPANQYRAIDFELPESIRYSAGLERTFTPQLRGGVLYSYVKQALPRGRNLNPVVGGVRPDPNFANVIETVTDAEARRHEIGVNGSLTLANASAASARLDWRRVTLTGAYHWVRVRRNAAGPFDVPPDGSLDTEWGPGAGDAPFRVNVSFTSTQLRNLNASLSYTANSGPLYTVTTGLDDNGDGLINDRPLGVGLMSHRGIYSATLNSRVAYTLTPSGSPADRAGRYRVILSVNAVNLTNHSNFGGYSGVMTSPFFLEPTLVINPRRVDFGLNVTF